MFVIVVFKVAKVDIDNGEHVTILQLGSATTINLIKFEIQDLQYVMYNYFIEVSEDNEKWERIIDYTDYVCHGMQSLYFPAKVIKFIRLVFKWFEGEIV